MRPVPLFRRAPGALPLAALALAGCRGAPPPDPAPGPEPASIAIAEPEPAVEAPRPAATAPDPPRPEDAREAAQSALAAGDIAATRAALDALETRPLLATCESHLLAGRVDAALGAAEAALATSPELPAALYLAGACRVRLGDADGDGTGDAAELERALDSLARARGCAGALAMASRIARGLGRHDEALELARAALAPPAAPCGEIQSVAARAGPRADFEPPERALASASLEAWRARRVADPARAKAHFEEALGALQLAVGPYADEDWPWRTLGEAYLEAGRSADALDALANGLDRLGPETWLLELLWSAALKQGGTGEVLRVFARVQAQRPACGLAWWYPGIEQFEAAKRVASDPVRLFDEAERALRTCRSKDGSMTGDCLRIESLCRAGRGWTRLAEGDLERAWSEFFGAGELVPGGLRLEDPPLRSARAGLEALIERCLVRADLEGAARAGARLAEDAPGDARALRQAGDLTRDLGDRLHLLERDLKLAARGHLRDPQRLEELRVEIGTSRPGDDLRGTEREKDKFFDRGDRRGREARETYKRALEFYRRALALQPDDLRLGCDATTLVVRRLGVGPRAGEAAREIDWAQDELLRLVAVGQAQLEHAPQDEQARYAFEEARGDVHQLLGELFLVQRRDPRTARVWLERCLAIGPRPRSEVSESLLPRCLEEERKAAGGRP